MSRHSSLNCVCVLAALAAVTFVTSTVRGEEKPKEKPVAKGEKKAPEGLQGYYMIIAKELNLSEEQKSKLIASLSERSGALKQWDVANSGKVAELTAAQSKAREAKDTEAAKKAGDELKTLKATRTAIEDEGKAKFHAVLTPDQRTHLHGYNLYIGAMIKFSKAELTDEQKAKAKAIAIETGKTVRADADSKEVDKAKADLAAKIEKDVLTDAQREQLAKLAAEKPKPKTKEPKATEKKPEVK